MGHVVLPELLESNAVIIPRNSRASKIVYPAMSGLERLMNRIRANRTTASAHPKPGMNRLLKIGGVVVFAVLLLAVTGLGSAIAHKVIFYAYVAQLSMQQP